MELKKVVNGCTSKESLGIMIIGTFPNDDSIVTSRCVKVWQRKSGTGQDEGEDSLEANN